MTDLVLKPCLGRVNSYKEATPCSNPRNPETTDGAFCSVECEERWARECLRKLSIDDILDLMCEIQSRVPPEEKKIEEEAEEARRFCRAFAVTA